MKKGVKQDIKAVKPKLSSTNKNYFFPNVSNQSCIKIALKLLGVSDQFFQKQCKASIKNDLFPKNTTASSSKTFFFICQLCIKELCHPQQAQELIMWYPPRTANEQIQFKKVFFKLIQKLQSQGNLPKNIILSKASISGDPTNDSVIQFLRVLSQMALRHYYIEHYSKGQRLIQVALTDSLEGDINCFYPFPFCESVTNVEPPLKGEQLQAIKDIFKVHIDRYRQKILALKTQSQVQIIDPSQLMKNVLDQKQIGNALTSKINNVVFSQNRAFDRRIIIDKHRQLWKELFSISTAFAQPTSTSILRVEGDIAKQLSGWKTVAGTHTLNDFNSKSSEVLELKAKCQKSIVQFKSLKQRIVKMIRQQ